MAAARARCRSAPRGAPRLAARWRGSRRARAPRSSRWTGRGAPSGGRRPSTKCSRAVSASRWQRRRGHRRRRRRRSGPPSGTPPARSLCARPPTACLYCSHPLAVALSLCHPPRAHREGDVVHQRSVRPRARLLEQRPRPLLLEPPARAGDRASAPKIVAYRRTEDAAGPQPPQPGAKRRAVLDVVWSERADAYDRISEAGGSMCGSERSAHGTGR